MTDKIEIHKIPLDKAQVVFDRIYVFIEKYHNDQLFNAKAAGIKHVKKSDFGLQELCFSIYTQGLIDGQQLPKQ